MTWELWNIVLRKLMLTWTLRVKKVYISAKWSANHEKDRRKENLGKNYFNQTQELDFWYLLIIKIKQRFMWLLETWHWLNTGVNYSSFLIVFQFEKPATGWLSCQSCESTHWRKCAKSEKTPCVSYRILQSG